ncbi:MAG: hypothetical protein ACYC3G_01045 [Minisyncoccota bacterium]
MIKRMGKIISILFIIGGMVLIFGKSDWFPDFYNPMFMGAMSFISAFLVVSSRIFLEPKDPQQEKVVDMIQAGMIFASVLGALGSLGLFQLYRIGIQYDKILHFLNSFILTIVLTRSFEIWKDFNFKRAITISIFIIFLGGIIWEIYELLGDTLFDTQMLGYYGKFVISDTVWDLVMNSFGIILGIFGLHIFKK